VSDLPGPFEDDSNGPKPTATFKVGEDWTFWTAFTPKAIGDKLAVINVAGGCRLWDLKEWTSTLLQIHDSDSDGAFGLMAQNSLHFTPDAEGFVTCVTTKTQPRIGFWRTQDYALRDTLEPGPPLSKESFRWSATITASRDGTMIGIASPQQGCVSTVDVATRSPIRTVSLGSNWPASISFSPDDRTLAVGRNSGRVLHLDAQTGKDLHQPLLHGTGLVTAVKFSPDGTILISAGKDGVVKAWDLSTYQSQSLPSSHKEKISSAEFSPDGKSLATTGRDGKMHLWDVEDLLTSRANLETAR
jgi:WD40 repeat protein